MKKNNLRGKRTYLSIAAMVCSAMAGINFNDVIKPEIASVLVSVFGLLAAYFRSVA